MKETLIGILIAVAVAVPSWYFFAECHNLWVGLIALFVTVDAAWMTRQAVRKMLSRPRGSNG